jgi:hypothetical protein
MTRLIEIRKGRPIVVRDATGAVKFSTADRMPFRVPVARVRKSVTVEWGYGDRRELPGNARGNVLGGGGAYYRIYRGAEGARDWPVAALPSMREFVWARGKITFSSLEVTGIGNNSRDRPQKCVAPKVPLDWAGGSIMVAEWLAQGSDYATWKWSWLTPLVVGRQCVLRLESSQVERRSANFPSPIQVSQGAWAKATVALDLDFFTWEGNRV